jgi:3-amino-4-hydroxybenzoic acid synthase
MQLAPQVIEMKKRPTTSSRIVWFDADENESLLVRAIHAGYSGALLASKSVKKYFPILSPRLEKIVSITSEEDLLSEEIHKWNEEGKLIVHSKDTRLLEAVKAKGYATALEAYVDDAISLHRAIELGCNYSYLVIAFKDPTNIPLELVIASLQSTETVLVKKIESENVDDAIVTLGVMEVGAEGVLFTPTQHAGLDKFVEKVLSKKEQPLKIAVATVTKADPVGMGYRSCIDLTTLFSEDEGMLVGSTSHGGILCCPEVFYLPYMELRPFRVNAGAVHSYVYNFDNQTDYMTELKAGSKVMITDLKGKTREAYVGRMKTEVRPLRLIEAVFENKQKVNILLQDDWHVRVYNAEGKPANITELKPGSKILGMTTDPGRHVGIKVNENILEN